MAVETSPSITVRETVKHWIQVVFSFACEACQTLDSRPTDLLYDSHQVVLLYDCGRCGAEYKAKVEAELGVLLRSCAFCDGRILPAGTSVLGSDGFSVGAICVRCGVNFRYHSSDSYSRQHNLLPYTEYEEFTSDGKSIFITSYDSRPTRLVPWPSAS